MKIMPKNFKTLRLSEGKLEFYDAAILESAEPQIVVRPKLVGICRSDIKEFLGTRTVRHDFGHEILGEVVSSNDSRLPQVGTTVVLDPHIKIQRSSGFGELIVATAGIEDLLKAFVAVPSSIPEERLVFTEPLSCAHHCVANLLRFEKGNRLEGLSIAVVGAGMTGILISLLCKYYGADVSIVNRSQERLDFLKSKSIFNKDKFHLSDAVNREFDVVIPTTTFLFPEVLELCEKIVKNKGLILLYGGTKVGDIFPGYADVDVDKIRRNQSVQRVAGTNKSFKVCGTHGATTEDFRLVTALLGERATDLPVEKLVSNRIRLEDVPKVITEMAQAEIPGKTIVGMSQSLNLKETYK